jgi:glycosyltransferase involved in cell wall biosynthesis
MGAANRARVDAEFTWQKVVDKLERVYADLVRSDGRKGEAGR